MTTNLPLFYRPPRKRLKGINTDRLSRTKALEVLGNKCVRCGFDDIRALQIDHINGGGYKKVKIIGRRKMYQTIALGKTEGYQLLCANCNWIKRVENREFCHTKS